MARSYAFLDSLGKFRELSGEQWTVVQRRGPKAYRGLLWDGYLCADSSAPLPADEARKRIIEGRVVRAVEGR